MTSETPVLPSSFFEPALGLDDTAARVRWYMCAIVASSSFNYPDIVPQIYKHFDSHVLSTLQPAERYDAVLKVREGLIKSTGIVGAARTGNAMRTLSVCIPEELLQKDSPRSKESDEVARKRGREFWTNIYARNPAFDPEASVRASPDYAFVVRGKSNWNADKRYFLKLTRAIRGPLCSRILFRWYSGPPDNRLCNGVGSLRNGLPEPAATPHERHVVQWRSSKRPRGASGAMLGSWEGTRCAI